ncbi:carbonic anhydrase 4b [Salminus brasiliensis]|uniref:carbonic anhydrase 4b n=1 Tax=Salminus brasiliensis TaxID=930266 RepID=UPI003B83081D
MTWLEFSGHNITRRMYAFYSALLLASLLRVTVGAKWCYESQVSCDHKCKGPNEWADIAPTCGGTSQSPINLVTKKITFKKSLTALEFYSYQETFHSVITNNGHTAKVNLSGAAQINGGELESNYKAMEIHFHWGKNGSPGSEHTIDGEQYPMEMHIVHIKEMYRSVEEALTDPSGVAVLGFLFQETGSSNKKYESIINALANIAHPGNSTTLQSLSLDLLIPSHSMLTSYFRYKGSLTTPGCTESVIWTVFEDAILLSKEQLSAFSALQFEDGAPMVGTFRPVQPLNGREVFYSRCNVVFVNTMLVVSAVLTTFMTLKA